MKNTITIINKKQRIMLFRASAAANLKTRQLGEGLTLLGDGEILRLPFELHDPEADQRFADGCAPDQAELLSAPPWLKIVENRPGPRVLATRDIKIKDTLIGQRLRPVRPENVLKLAESLKQGQYRPITVRPHPKHGGKFEAIAGVTLIKAAESLGWTTIRADILECDDKEAELWQALENLYRSELTALEQAEHLAVIVRRIAERESGQTAKKGKSKGGRPESVVTKTARDLPVPGKTQAARKKALERGLRIAAMLPEVKTEILEAGLDGNQSALIEIAEQDTTEGQLAKIQEIAQKKTSSKAKGRNRRIGKTKKTKPAASKASLSPNDEEVLAKLIKAWKQAAQAVRDSFIEHILRSASGDEGDTETKRKPTDEEMAKDDDNDHDNDDENDDDGNDHDSDDGDDNEQSNDDWA